MGEHLSRERCARRKEKGRSIPILLCYCAFSSTPPATGAVAAPSTLATTAVRAVVGLAGLAAGDEARGTAGEEVEGPEGAAMRRSSASRASCLCAQQARQGSQHRKSERPRQRHSGAPPPLCLSPLSTRYLRVPSSCSRNARLDVSAPRLEDLEADGEVEEVSRANRDVLPASENEEGQ